MGEGTTGWTGSGKGWRVPPSPRPWPLGMEAGLGPAWPFPSSSPVWNRSGSRLPARQKTWGWGAVGGLLRGRHNGGSAGSGRGTPINTQHRKCERTTTQHTSQGASNPPIRGGTHTSAQNLTLRHSAPHGRRGHITTVAEPGRVAQTATGCLPTPHAQRRTRALTQEPRVYTHTCDRKKKKKNLWQTFTEASRPSHNWTASRHLAHARPAHTAHRYPGTQASTPTPDTSALRVSLPQCRPPPPLHTSWGEKKGPRRENGVPTACTPDSCKGAIKVGIFTAGSTG